MSIAIKVENLSKIYRLGEIGTGTISRDLQRWVAKMRGNEDPFLKIGETNDRTKKGSDIVYSLQNLNFEIEQGDAVGIIGRNGAGKSTLLKILSRVTSPTTGRINIKGRVASLLEVGTGFHPELTGKDNIYLNGAILGMRKKEIDRKLDAIIDFSGVERYIDTPVKRYSSGMYVRLAFAVAAHLESEILIVDEVLAVGDAEFQKKCLGKMRDVSNNDGRTVLFVSHNMAAIKQLCTHGLLMKNGTVKYEGNIEQTVSLYFEAAEVFEKKGAIPENYKRYNTGQARIKMIQIVNDKNEAVSEVFYNDKIRIYMKIEAHEKIEQALIDVKIVSTDGVIITHSINLDSGAPYFLEKGEHEFEMISDNLLQPGFYNINAGLHYASTDTIDYLEHIYDFEVLKIGKDKDYIHSWVHGYLKLNSTWKKL